MTTVPSEFDPDFVRSQAMPETYMYRDEVRSQEPMKSVLENNPEIYFVPPKRSTEWGQWEFKKGSYYDTTIAAKHPYWKNQALPRPSKNIQQLRNDMLKWGYCKIENALSQQQIEVIRNRVLEQAAGEKKAGIAQKTPSGQNINCCVNKGRCFELLIEQHPSVVQGGQLVEQLIDEALGDGWICTSLIASISLRGGVPQALHQDQSNALDSRSPMTVNVLSAISGVDETNGGTLLIPGSHKILSDAVREGVPVGKLPPAINLDAEAGTMVITDGRLLHATGINHSETPRIMMLNGMQKSWMRQQENWMLSVKPEVLHRASFKLLHRMGFQATTGTQTNEGHGFGAKGQPGEAAGAILPFRLALDRGEYVRVGELTPDSTAEQIATPFTLRDVVKEARKEGNSAPVGIGGVRQTHD
ncbi:MAG: phytanoyl-CoA dioxygenase family protein [Pseudomonadales bacterium]|nr:phytanoyl-CoA dioxygenase family protein [Pseudomonadales bacterium]